MFDNDVRGLKLVTELKGYTKARDSALEFSMRADGSVRITGFRMIRGRTISDVAQRWGKSATIIMCPESGVTEVDFRDDVGWKTAIPVVGSIGDKLDALGSAVLGLVQGTASVEEQETLYPGSTRLMQVRVAGSASLPSCALRNILATPAVIDVLIFRNGFDVMLARNTNLVGGLAHIGSTRGFRPVKPKTCPRARNGSRFFGKVTRAGKNVGRLPRG